ncbi:MAG: restriction endonuclease subunit S [Clostridia bacterium]|nr:restriction endonuclease subunit S [Clostridia bacterium]
MKFESVKIADLISEISMGPFGSNIKVECFVDDGIPVLNGSNLEGYALKEDSFRYVTEEKADSLGKANAYRGDVVITHRGTLGQIVFIPQNSKYNRYVISQSQFRVKCNERLLPEYLVYYFHTRIGQYKLLSNSSQVGVPALARASTTFQMIEIEVPEIKTQRKIVGLLESIRQKIVINNEINNNLLQQAQALFISWFVDYEPFGGIIPDDWKDISVYDLADYINGAAFKKNEYSDTGLPIIKISELKNGITDSTQRCCVTKDDKYYIDDRDILFSWSGNPDTSIDAFIWSMGRAILNQHTFRVVSKYDAPAFTFFLLKYLKPQFTHIASNKQTTGLGHVTVADLKRMQFRANAGTIAEFNSITMPMFDLIYSNYKEIQQLSVLRDTLLPQLMSGELDVSTIDF